MRLRARLSVMGVFLPGNAYTVTSSYSKERSSLRTESCRVDISRDFTIFVVPIVFLRLRRSKFDDGFSTAPSLSVEVSISPFLVVSAI